MIKYNEKLADKVIAMSLEQLMSELYTDHLTDVWNRRALEELGHTGPVAICDLDSLKWINDNLSHRDGDEALKQLAMALETFFNDKVYRLAGDEFVVVADSREALLGGLLLAQGRVKRGVLMGKECTVVGAATFSWGIGEDLIQADRMLGEDKVMRETVGERSPRGEAPPGAIPRLRLVDHK